MIEKELAMKIIALETICMGLMAEIAILNRDPRTKIGKMSSGFLGLAEGIADQSGFDTSTITKAIEHVCAGAESALVSPSKERGR